MRPGGLSRRAVLAGLGLGLAGAARANAPATSLVPVPRPVGSAPAVTAGKGRIRDIVAEIALPGQTAYAVADARTGELLDARNPGRLLPTASVAKFVTAQYALEAFGPAHVFRTRVTATAPMIEGRVDGDLVLLGGGDPMLDSDDLAAMVRDLVADGLKQVTGRLLVHRGALPLVPRIDASQPAHLSYNPAVSGLNLNFNRVYFEWKKNGEGYETRMDARGATVQPEIAMTRMEVVDRNAPVYAYRGGQGTERWSVARGALGRDGARWLPVRNPALYAGHALHVLLAGAGIRTGPPQLVMDRPASHVLTGTESLPMERIIRSMLYYSTNLIAEVLGLNASVARGGNPASLPASAAMMNRWMVDRFAAERPRFADHSGLGEQSRATAGDLVASLAGMGPEGVVGQQMRRHPMPKEAAHVEVRAKTGTLNFVSGLAGFARAGGRDLAFAILASDMERRRAIPEAERERPRGARGWANRARYQDGQLLMDWARRFG